jgi:hypothetical protein
MALSCSCREWDGDGWYYFPPEDFETLKTKKSRRCKSCYAVIKPGDECVSFARYRGVKDDVEANIYGDDYCEIPIATWYQCAKCGEIALNLSALGYCVPPDENMYGLLREYHEITNWTP